MPYNMAFGYFYRELRPPTEKVNIAAQANLPNLTACTFCEDGAGKS
jgi:hypothetical protein